MGESAALLTTNKMFHDMSVSGYLDASYVADGTSRSGE